jgi:phage anti-repressor protein
MMATESNFQQAYSRLRDELLGAIENTPTNLVTTHDSLIKSDYDFPLEFAKKIALIYESEQTNKIAEGNALAIEFTDDKLKSLLETFKKQYCTLIKEENFQLAHADPLFCMVDAFSHIEWGLQEVPHTKMLAFFLDPEREHGLDSLPMEFFLVAASLSESEIEIDVENYHQISVSKVETEKWIRINREKYRRLDVYIEMTKPKCRILIEGKIKGKQGYNQLSDYAEWFKPEENDILIYLTPNEEELENPWHLLDWKDVASSFCALANYCEKEEKEKKSLDGFQLLRLWTSTLLHHVCSIPTVDCSLEDNSLIELVKYNSHIIKVKEILEEYKGEQYADQQIA